MESSSSQCLKQFEVSYKCDQCEKEYKKIISYPSLLTNHETIELLKLRLKNENLVLQMELFTDQIKLLKKLILIQEHTLRTHGRSTTRPSGIPNLNNRLPGM